MNTNDSARTTFHLVLSRLTFFWIGLILLIFSVTASGQQCKYFNNFIDNGDGSVTDPRTQLIWKRCAEGFEWQAGTCVGEEKKFKLADAMTLAKESRFQNRDNWRLPTRAEFQSIIDSNCGDYDLTPPRYAVSPMLAHPVRNKSPGKFWTPDRTIGNYDSMSCGKELGYTADFFFGTISADYQFANCESGHVRLIRSKTPQEIADFKLAQQRAQETERARDLALQQAAEQTRLQEIKAVVARCINARVPNPNPQPEESTEFYGSCDAGGDAQTGIVIWKHRDHWVSISCLDNRNFASTTRTDQFQACAPYWATLPDYCQNGVYQGQCRNGRAHGLGFETGSGSTVYVKTGHFENGVLHGYAHSASVSGCGPAGCSGNRISESGWFQQGAKQIDCTTYYECSQKISGKDLALERRKWNTSAATNLEDLRKQNDFASAMEAFYLSGERHDLKRAQALAKSSENKAQFEFTLMQTAGYDKSLHLSAKVKNGKQSVSMHESERLLGFFSSINTQVPVSIDWGLKSNKELLSLQHGEYEVVLSLGLNVKINKQTSFLGFSQSRSDVNRYVQKRTVVLNSKNGFQSSGTINLSISGADTTSMFGTESNSTIQHIEPVIRIESVSLKSIHR